MTTAQVAPNGHHVPPPPRSLENPAELNSADLPANQANLNNTFRSEISDLPSPDAPSAFAAGAYHVPPELYAPKADSFHDTIPDGLGAMKLPDRCQFMFSDGRQCTMVRSDIHPSLCTYHSEREEQLFGAPHTLGGVRGASFDLPELFSASRDLTTAAGVNRALGQVFRLLAQRRISRQEASTFAKLAQLLLQSIRAARAEVLETQIDAIDPVVRGEYSERSAQFASQSVFREISPELSHRAVSPLRSQISDLRSPDGAASSAASHAPAQTSTPAISVCSEPPGERVAMNNSHKISTSAPSACNSPEISTYKNTRVNPLQNQHLHKHTANETGAEAPFRGETS